jgi:hypothetical protein
MNAVRLVRVGAIAAGACQSTATLAARRTFPRRRSNQAGAQ